MPDMDHEVNNRNRNRRRRRVRRLGAENPEGVRPVENASFFRSWGRMIIFFIVLLISIKLLTIDQAVLEEIVRTYKMQYQAIVRGDQSCSPKLNIAAIFKNFHGRDGILHQEDALNQFKIKLMYNNNSKVNAFAFVGPSGVGKSMCALKLKEQFPWPENVRSYMYNTYVKDEVQKIRLLRLYLRKLSECGQNLLIIDNLGACDHGIVPVMNEMISKDHDETAANAHIILIYIFNLNAMANERLYDIHYKMLQKLPNTTTINFKRFGVDELKDCIRYEAVNLNLTLKDNEFDEIVATINPIHSGCKNVVAKILTYGKTPGIPEF